MPTDYAIKDGRTVFDATTYTGTGSAQTITNAGKFQPDFVWQKARAEVANHRLADSVRGVDKVLYSSSTAAEATTDGVVDSFNSNGFTGGGGDVVGTGNPAVAWQWQAGQGTTSSNTNGSITSTVSANPTAGFSIVTYTGNGSAGATVGHGLGVAPSFIVLKIRSGVANWCVYQASLGNTKGLYLNTTDAAVTDVAFWNNTSPTSSVFSLGNGSSLNSSGLTYVAYCWSEIAGFSKFGSYTGNGSADGPFVYTGFRPRYILFKQTSASGNDWQILDSARDTINPAGNFLQADLPNGEGAYSAVDFLSNGFRHRSTLASLNASGATYIYAAFAENPFKYANAR